jgi:ABC-type Zn uptake system ZnuABC Zn-binding protein ZnuA/ABC-type Mn2+/Zn2+ transport system permease subunit
MLDVFDLPFVQRGLLEVLLLAVGAGLLGTWIVLRGLAFFVHATGTAAFPGLVLADGLGFAASLGALGTAAVVAVVVATLRDRRAGTQDSLVAVTLAGCLALGVILASDVFRSGAHVETLLFGSLLLVDGSDLALAAGASAAVLACSWAFGERWLAEGFDPDAANALGLRSQRHTLVLLGLVALTAVASLQAIGGLLVSAVFVVPAATTRLACQRMRTWQAATVALVAVEGVVGLWLSVQTNTPPGAAIAVVAGGAFALTAVARTVRHRRGLAAGLAAAALASAGCGIASGSRETVVATTTELADLTRQVAGGEIEVVGLLRPSTDPHEYEPRPRDVRDTATAKLVLRSGDPLDAWMRKVVSEAGGDATVVDVGSAVPVRLPGETSGPDRSRFDPHWWHDPRNVQAAVVRIRDALTEEHPDGAGEFRRNAASYLARLRALDRGIARCLAPVPATERKIVTDHDAFGYFAHRYGITVVGAVIPSQTTQAQASAGELARLSALIRRERVRAVFPERSVSSKVARALARQTGASAAYTLYGDTLGPAGSPAATYLGMEEANANAIVRGLTGGRRGCTIGGIR